MSNPSNMDVRSYTCDAETKQKLDELYVAANGELGDKPKYSASASAIIREAIDFLYSYKIDCESKIHPTDPRYN